MENLNQPYMRVFDGSFKLDEETLNALFLTQLNNIYCAKNHLITVLPDMAERASFPEFREAILTDADNIKLQILRMDLIYKKMNLEYEEDNCLGLKFIALDAFKAGNEGKAPMLVDMSMLIHLRIIESIEITSFNVLSDIAAALNNEDVSTLLDQNLQSAINTKRIFELIGKEYIG